VFAYVFPSRKKPRVVGWARLTGAPQVIDAIKDLVQDCNFDCNDSGIALQAMDNSHVALVSMMLKAEGFSPYRCDRNIALGVNLTSLTKVLRAAQNEDILTLKAADAPDVLNLIFENTDSDRLSEYDLKLMDIDQEHLGIPDTDYAATISMPTGEFRRICTDLAAMAESGGFPSSAPCCPASSVSRIRPADMGRTRRTVTIDASKDGVKFSCQGDIGSGAVTLRSHTNVEKPAENIEIDLSEPVSLTFSLKYLTNFCKASGLSSQVKISLSNEVPLLVEYNLEKGNSYLRFYLAPKASKPLFSVRRPPADLPPSRLAMRSRRVGHRSVTGGYRRMSDERLPLRAAGFSPGRYRKTTYKQAGSRRPEEAEAVHSEGSADAIISCGNEMALQVSVSPLFVVPVPCPVMQRYDQRLISGPRFSGRLITFCCRHFYAFMRGGTAGIWRSI